MGLGGNAYGHDLIERCGATNVLAARPRYRAPGELSRSQPGHHPLPDEPYPFKPSDAESFAAVAPARVIDGKLRMVVRPADARSRTRPAYAVHEGRNATGGTS